MTNILKIVLVLEFYLLSLNGKEYFSPNRIVDGSVSSKVTCYRRIDIGILRLHFLQQFCQVLQFQFAFGFFLLSLSSGRDISPVLYPISVAQSSGSAASTGLKLVLGKVVADEHGKADDFSQPGCKKLLSFLLIGFTISFSFLLFYSFFSFSVYLVSLTFIFVLISLSVSLSF